MGGRRVTKEDRETFVKLRNDGKTIHEISLMTGRAYATVHNTLKKVDFTPTRKKPDHNDISSPDGNIIDNFTPLYKRIKYLNEQKRKINEELRNLRSTLENALDIIDNGDTAEAKRPAWGVLNHDCRSDSK